MLYRESNEMIACWMAIPCRIDESHKDWPRIISSRRYIINIKYQDFAWKGFLIFPIFFFYIFFFMFIPLLFVNFVLEKWDMNISFFWYNFLVSLVLLVLSFLSVSIFFFLFCCFSYSMGLSFLISVHLLFLFFVTDFY